MTEILLNLTDNDLMDDINDQTSLVLEAKASILVLTLSFEDNECKFLMNGESARKVAIALLNWAGSNTASLGEELGEALAQELTRHDTRINKIETFLKSFGGS